MDVSTLSSRLKNWLAKRWRGVLAACGLLHVRVGVAVIIFDGNKVLFGQRTGSDLGSDLWQVGGGHLEFGETFENAASREVREETGLRLKNIRTIYVTCEVYQHKLKHYATIWMAAEIVDPSDLTQGLEPDKCHGWRWFDLSTPPSPIFEGGSILSPEVLGRIRTFLSMPSNSPNPFVVGVEIS